MTLLYLPETHAAAPFPGYHIRLAGVGNSRFDGPLELLIRMVREGRADPLEIRVAAITRQYLDVIRVMEVLDLQVGSEFLKLATVLLRIKARRLLPRPSAAETRTEEELLADLNARLAEYARYRDAAVRLRRNLRTRSAMWVRPQAKVEESAPALPETMAEVDLFAVVEAFRRVVDRSRAKPRVPAPQAVLSVSSAMRRIEAATPPGVRRNFEDLLETILAGRTDRPAFIAAFLAVLELARRRRISVLQDLDFGPIWIVGRAS